MITLYEYRKRGDKFVTNFLYGLYTKEEQGDTWKRRFAFLFEAERKPEGIGFQLLSGLFAIDRRRVKLLYIPIKRGTSEPAVESDEGHPERREGQTAEEETWQE